MDINSLLSPSDSPAGTPTPQPPPALPSPSMLRSPGKSKRAVRQMPSRTPSGLSQQITSSPQPHAVLQQVPSPGFAHIANGARAMHSAMSTPQPLGSPRDARMTPPHQHMFRQASTPGMDTLAGRCSLSFCRNISVLQRKNAQLVGQHRDMRRIDAGHELYDWRLMPLQILQACSSNNKPLDRPLWRNDQ